MATFNPMDLTGRTILVTGASSGIGREVCLLLARLGARVVLMARNEERLAQTRARMEGDGHLTVAFDLEATDEIPPAVKRIVAATGPLDGLVHCAGVHVLVPVRAMTEAQIRSGLLLSVHASLGLARGLRQKGCYREGTRLVLLSAAAALVGLAGSSAYAAGKGGMISLTRSLAAEFAREGIRVNCVVPAGVRTEMLDGIEAKMPPDQFERFVQAHPLGLGETADIAYAVAFLLAETGRWITGTSLVVDGGFSAT